MEAPDEGRKIEEVAREGYRQDLVIFFPRCFVPEICPAERFRGYFLCTDNEERRCTLTYRQSKEVVCRLGEYSLVSRRIMREKGMTGKVLVIPGGRQIVDVCLAYGLPRAVLGVACPPDLKEGREKMESLGVRSFIVPLTKLEYELNNIKKPTVQSCYENVVKDGMENYLKALDKAMEYARDCRDRNLKVEDYKKAR